MALNLEQFCLRQTILIFFNCANFINGFEFDLLLWTLITLSRLQICLIHRTTTLAEIQIFPVVNFGLFSILIILVPNTCGQLLDFRASLNQVSFWRG